MTRCEHYGCRLARARALVTLTEQIKSIPFSRRLRGLLVDEWMLSLERPGVTVPCVLARVDREVAAIRRRVLAWQ